MNLFLYILLYLTITYLVVLIAFYFIQEKLLFVSKHISDLKPYRFASSFNEIVFNTSNKGEIHSLQFYLPNPKGVILYLHGNTGNLKRWGYSAEELLEFGYDVFVIDYRGYGKSKGKRKESYMHQDVEDVFDQIKSNNSYKKHVVYGRSLGTGFAVQLAYKKRIDYLILETPYYSMVDVAFTNFPFLPMHLLLRFKLYSNIYINSVEDPILILHGTKDKIVRYKSALRLYNFVMDRENATMVTFVGGKHNNLNKYPLFREKLAEALK